MAELVSIVGVPHTPGLPRAHARGDERGGEQARGFEGVREMLLTTAPDLLIVLGNDHLNQWFMNNMPAFLVGKSPRARGPFVHEHDTFGIPPYDVAVDQQFALQLFVGASREGVDLAFSDEFTLDHSFVVPLLFLSPDAKLPVVPLYTNTMIEPMPSAARFYDVGAAIASVIERIPGDRRVAVVGTGHFSTEIGGPRMGMGGTGNRPDPTFDQQALEHFRVGEVSGLLALASPERMRAAGNLTSGFLNYVLLAGMANGRPTSSAEFLGASPFLVWSDLGQEP